MAQVGLPNFFLAGCQKTASTWLHRCLREHPGIYVPETDAIHYFTINYNKGIEWYREFYRGCKDEDVVGDTTPSYIRSFQAPRRIAEFNPDSKIIFSLRNPIDRAFSHYWHEKKKGKISFDFEECIMYRDVGNYDLFSDWIEPGFYYEHLDRFYDYFHRSQVMILIFEDIRHDPEAFIRQVYRFLEVDPGFQPSVLRRRVNKAGRRYRGRKRMMKRAYQYSAPIRSALPSFMREGIKNLLFNGRSPGRVKTEYEEGVDESIREQLREIYHPHNEKLAQHIGRDLSFWT